MFGFQLARVARTRAVMGGKNLSGLFLTSPMKTTANRKSMTTATVKQRPLSPHLTIYKFRVNMITSVIFRGTGIFMAGGMAGLAVIALLAPKDIRYYIYQVQQYPIINALFKFGVAFPLSYHFFGGLRHLAWDQAIGNNIKAGTQTGYAAVAAATAVAVIAMVTEVEPEH